MQENKILNEDEIDLRELFKTIWDKRFFIIIFTFIPDKAAIFNWDIKDASGTK